MQSLLGLAVATTGIMLAGAAPALSQERVGEAVVVKTSVTGDSGPVAVKSPVHRDERIRTSNTGLGEFLFRDGTKFAVGWNSSVVIDEFVFKDSNTVQKLSLNAARGTFRWISGKSKSSAYEITTPAGTLGIRGTGLDIYVGAGGITAIVLLSGAATFCGSNGCQDLTRRCDVVVATPSGGVAPADRVNRDIFNVLGTPSVAAFPDRQPEPLSGDFAWFPMVAACPQQTLSPRSAAAPIGRNQGIGRIAGATGSAVPATRLLNTGSV